MDRAILLSWFCVSLGARVCVLEKESTITSFVVYSLSGAVYMNVPMNGACVRAYIRRAYLFMCTDAYVYVNTVVSVSLHRMHTHTLKHTHTSVLCVSLALPHSILISED